jgi:hypothetical protein
MKNVDDPDGDNAEKEPIKALERPPLSTREYIEWSMGDKANRSGRPSGALNSANTIRKRMKELGFDWVEYTINRLLDPKTPDASRDYLTNLLASKIAPTLKSMEIKDTTERAVLPPQFNIVAIPVPQPIENDLVTITHEPSIDHSDIVSNTIDNDNGTIDDSP